MNIMYMRYDQEEWVGYLIFLFELFLSLNKLIKNRHFSTSDLFRLTVSHISMQNHEIFEYLTNKIYKVSPKARLAYHVI